jgi:CheY-like chemotaxis protein
LSVVHPYANRPRILLVDDSALVHELARVALETVAGWEVVSAHSGAEALELSPTEPFDAVLVDVEMPDMDGPATVRALRATAAGKAVPVLFLTGHDDPRVVERLEALEVDGVLPKPFDVAGLAGAIADQLGWQR